MTSMFSLSPARVTRLRQWKRVLSARARHGVASREEVLRLGTIRSTLYILTEYRQEMEEHDRTAFGHDGYLRTEGGRS